MIHDNRGNPVPDAPEQSPDELIAMYELTPCAWAGCFLMGFIFGAATGAGAFMLFVGKAGG